MKYIAIIIKEIGQNLDTFTSYPTAYNRPNVITVGASDEYDNIWQERNSDNELKKSNTGKNSVHLFAPGKRILSTYPTDICDENGQVDNATTEVAYGYHVDSGTSFAAPFVTGVAALMLSINPNLTTAQLKDIIIRSVDIAPLLQNSCVSGGRLNAYKAVWIASILRFDYRYTYNSLDAYTHGVICDTCECSCRNDDYSCGSGCDFGCDPCEECHLYYTELHYWTYWIIQGNVLYHTARCRDCGYSKMTAHNWVSSGSVYVCTLCGMTSTYAPVITAVLPPVNDEELTE